MHFTYCAYGKCFHSSEYEKCREEQAKTIIILNVFNYINGVNSNHICLINPIKTFTWKHQLGSVWYVWQWWTRNSAVKQEKSVCMYADSVILYCMDGLYAIFQMDWNLLVCTNFSLSSFFSFHLILFVMFFIVILLLVLIRSPACLPLLFLVWFSFRFSGWNTYDF